MECLERPLHDRSQVHDPGKAMKVATEMSTVRIYAWMVDSA